MCWTSVSSQHTCAPGWENALASSCWVSWLFILWVCLHEEKFCVNHVYTDIDAQTCVDWKEHLRKHLRLISATWASFIITLNKIQATYPDSHHDSSRTATVKCWCNSTTHALPIWGSEIKEKDFVFMDLVFVWTVRLTLTEMRDSLCVLVYGKMCVSEWPRCFWWDEECKFPFKKAARKKFRRKKTNKAKGGVDGGRKIHDGWRCKSRTFVFTLLEGSLKPNQKNCVEGQHWHATHSSPPTSPCSAVL